MASPFPPALTTLIKLLERLPGVGEKTATRYALHVLRWPKAQAQDLAQAVAGLHERIRLCSRCLTFSEADPCPVCADQTRETSVVCVVEEPGDLLAIEKSGGYRGLYHVLHGALAPSEGIGPDQIRTAELLERVSRDGISEVILATSSTVAGEATAAYLSDILETLGKKVTRIACGIPMGMDLKYADQMTLRKALDARYVMG